MKTVFIILATAAVSSCVSLPKPAYREPQQVGEINSDTKKTTIKNTESANFCYGIYQKSYVKALKDIKYEEEFINERGLVESQSFFIPKNSKVYAEFIRNKDSDTSKSLKVTDIEGKSFVTYKNKIPVSLCLVEFATYGKVETEEVYSIFQIKNYKTQPIQTNEYFFKLEKGQLAITVTDLNVFISESKNVEGTYTKNYFIPKGTILKYLDRDIHVAHFEGKNINGQTLTINIRLSAQSGSPHELSQLIEP